MTGHHSRHLDWENGHACAYSNRTSSIDDPAGYAHVTAQDSTDKRFQKSLIRQIPVDNYDVREIGRWWGTIVKRNAGDLSYESSDIDIVADINVGNAVVQLFVECKFRNERCGLSTLHDLEERMKSVNRNGRPMIISRSGFTDELLEYAEDHNILLIGMDEIVGRNEFPQLI